MKLLEQLLNVIGVFNDKLLTIGRAIGIVAVGLMVVAILIQVVFRYVLNNALPWPDEAARFCMLWMMGLMAPTAFRRGGFVAIDMFIYQLPRIPSLLVTLFLLSVSAVVLAVAVNIGWGEVTGFGGRFTTASLYVPTSIAFDSFYQVPRSWMMASLLVGVILLLWVNIELILKAFLALIDGSDPRNTEDEQRAKDGDAIVEGAS